MDCLLAVTYFHSTHGITQTLSRSYSHQAVDSLCETMIYAFMFTDLVPVHVITSWATKRRPAFIIFNDKVKI